jgi:hypothetical protein
LHTFTDKARSNKETYFPAQKDRRLFFQDAMQSEGLAALFFNAGDPISIRQI